MSDSTLILAGDVSKGYADFVLLRPDGELLQNVFRLGDSAADHSVLEGLLLDWRQTHACTRLLLVVESTGGYEDHWLGVAKRPALASWVESYRLNPRITHHEYRIQSRGSIDDGISALTIGQHVCKNLATFEAARCLGEPDPAWKAARQLVVHIQQLEKSCTAYKNALDKLLYQYLPFMISLRTSRWAQYYLTILSKYGSLNSIKRAASQGFKTVKRVPKAWSEQLGALLKDTSHLASTPSMIRYSIEDKARQITHLEKTISKHKKMLIQQAPVEPTQVALLCSIAGMGAYTAILLLLYIQDVRRFASAAKLAAFFGVCPRMKKSGDAVNYKAHMSKQGNGRVRCELYNLAFRTLSTEPYLRAIYAKQRKKGMAHDAALGVLMHKIVRIIYGMLKHQKAFDPGVDQLNQVDPRTALAQSTALAQPQAGDANNERSRFQTPAQAAPVSKRQRKKRKSHASQATLAVDHTGSS